MSVKEELIEKPTIFSDLEETGKRSMQTKEEDITKDNQNKSMKRKYRIILWVLFFLSIILILMILPMVLATIIQGLWV